MVVKWDATSTTAVGNLAELPGSRISSGWFCSLAVVVALVAGLHNILSSKSLLNALHLFSLCRIVTEMCNVARSRSVRRVAFCCYHRFFRVFVQNRRLAHYCADTYESQFLQLQTVLVQKSVKNQLLFSTALHSQQATHLHQSATYWSNTNITTFTQTFIRKHNYSLSSDLNNQMT